MCTFLPQILSNQLCIANNSLFDARDINKPKKYLFLQEFSQIYGSVSISFSGPVYPSRVVHINLMLTLMLYLLSENS